MREDIKKRIEAVHRGDVPEGYRIENGYLIPDEWKTVPLNERFTRSTRKNKSGCENVLTISAQMGLVNQREFYDKDIASEDKSGYFLMKNGEFAYNKSYSAGYPYGAIKQLTKYDEGIVSPLYICFAPKAGTNTAFYTQYFEGGRYNREIYRIAQEGARNHGLLNVAVDDFFTGMLAEPGADEQQKIAEILATCDRVIELKQQLLEEKRRQKQWLMKNLLDPNSGVRLPGYENSEWYTVTLDEYCDCLDTRRKPVNAQQREKMQGSYPYWGANSVQGYVNDYLFDEEIVLLAEDGGCFDDFKTKPIAVYVNEKCWVNNHAHILRAKNGNTKLLYFVLVHKDIRNYINGTTRSKLTQGDMMSIAIMLPQNPQEQKLLIEVLTAGEAEIELLEQELAAWQQKKKALMQLLLTGLVRVNA